MRMTMKALALAGACGMAVCAGSARADVIYTFTTTQAETGTGGRTLPLGLTYDLADAVVQAGMFTLSAPGNNGGPPRAPLPQFTGDANGFTSLTITTGRPSDGDFDSATVMPTFLFGRISTALSFDAIGDVTSSMLDFLGELNQATLLGTGTTATGSVASDANVCLGIRPCVVSGSWTHTAFTLSNPVPEPASFALLGAGVLGLALARCRAA